MDSPSIQTKLMRRPKIFLLATAFIFCSAVYLSGCASLGKKGECEPVFAPQQVMETKDYDSFLKENELLLSTCQTQGRCEVPLFNIGFLHAYSQSPYYDRPKALKYFAKIVKEYPKSPQAYESLVWMDLLTENVTLDKKQRELKGQVKSKNATIKSKNATISELRDRMKRSRDIDVEMGQKEREVLY